MAFVWMIPAVVSALVLAAHFMRGFFSPHGGWVQGVLMGVSLSAIPLVAIPRPWAARAVQVILFGGAVVWLGTMVMLVQQREEEGRPWLPMVVILGSVMAVTAGSALLLEMPAVRRWHGRGRGHGFDVIQDPGPGP